MQRMFLADESQRVLETTATKLAEVIVTAKAGTDQATFYEVRRVSSDDAQADLDEVIANMISEGCPNC